MRIADIIRLNDKKSTGKKSSPYSISQAPEKNEPVAVINDGQGGSFSDENNEMKGLYSEQLVGARSIFDKAMEDFNISPDRGTIHNMTKGLVDKLSLSSVSIIDMFMNSGEENYLYSHSVNVSFLSVMLGVWLNYNKSDLCQLAEAALLHDVGMVKVLRLALLPRRLSPSERKSVEEHPNYSSEFLSRIPDIENRVIEAARNHHQRISSPEKAIDEYSQIIGLADSFEAMTHPRVYKKSLEPHSAIRKIIEELKGMFDSRIIKALIDNIGIYPVGTWVRLDTEEIGLVIDINSGFALSPKVNILFNQDEEALIEPRTVDLSKQKNMHIKGLLEKKVETRLKERLS